MAIKTIGSVNDVVSLEEAREQLRVVPFGSPAAHPDDAYITRLIVAAREFCENHTGISIGSKQYELALDSFPENILLVPYVHTVNSLTYVASDGNTQTIAESNYHLDNYSEPSWLIPANGYTWPDTLDGANVVKVNFNAGFTDGLVTNDNPCPEAIKQAILLLVGSWYENRQQDVMSNSKNTLNQLPSGVFSLLQPYRINMGM